MRINLDQINREFHLRSTINEAVTSMCSWIIHEKIGDIESIRWVEDDADFGPGLTACIHLSIGHRPRMVYDITISSTQTYKARYFCTHTKYNTRRTLLHYLKTQKEALS